MEKMSRRVVGIAALLCLGFLLPLCAWSRTLKQVATIDLPGPKGERFDYLTVDDEDHYLLSAHLGPGILYVIDMRTNKLVKAIPGVPGITGLEYVPDTHKVYTSDWGEKKIGIVDLHSMTVVKRLATAAKPNGSTYASPFHKVYVSDTLGKAVAVVDVDKDEIVKTMEFASETGMPQYDSVARKVYVNLRNTNEIAEIDPATDTILAKYPVEGCQFNHGMAVDSEHHRAFLLCSGNRTFAVFALDSHKAIAHLPMPAGADVVKFDPSLDRIYVACSSGFISVFQEQDADHYRKLEDFAVEKMVHSLAVDSATHRVYAPEQQERGQPVARMIVYEPVAAAPNKP
ncbi:MAG TPA: YncE family protein [Candidatus Dormibacteraeota bacterium]|nr:YncE family protein [Candidatus Dormibacteraeota bacterium]